jgi:hypothetical protein
MTYIAPPVHTLADFQIEYNGLLMGNGTPYYLPPDGSWAFFDMAAVKTMDQARTWADGSWSGPDFSDVALPSVNFHVDAADPVTFANLVAAFWQAFGPQAVSQPLWVKLPNMPVRGVAAKPHKRVLPATNIWSTHAEGALQWRCPDPAWQSIPRSLVLTGAGAALTGMTFPLFAAVFDVLDFGATGTAAASGTLTNAGNTPAWPVAVITAPGSLIIDGFTVTYAQAIPAGQTVTIDYKAGTATLTGDIDRTTQLTVRQFSPVTSSSSVFFSAASGTATLTVADIWR